jgi:RHS repeat-associated protein
MPKRGVIPTGAYALSDIETVDMQSGNVLYRIPVTSLPPGRAGWTAGLSLIYNSQAYDLSFAVDASKVEVGQNANFAYLNGSQWGGWRYAFSYGINVEVRPGTGGISCTDPSQPWKLFRLSLVTPDGAPHTLYLYPNSQSVSSPGEAYRDIGGEGYYDVMPGTTGAICPSTVPLGSGPITYFTTDGSYLKVVFNNTPGAYFSSIPWTVYMPDGKTVTGTGTQVSAMLDQNGNAVHVVNTFDASSSAIVIKTSLQDDVGHRIDVQYNPNSEASSSDTISQTGADGSTLQWTVNWTTVTGSPSVQYLCSDLNDYCSGTSAGYRAVSSIMLPTTQSYTFGYSTSVGWGELNSVSLPSGATVQYTWSGDNHFKASLGNLTTNSVATKTLNWTDENTTPFTPRTEVTTYCLNTDNLCSPSRQNTVTNPDGGTVRYVFEALPGHIAPLLRRVTQPDGSTSEQIWSQNFADSWSSTTVTADSNPYVQYAIRSAALSGSAQLAQVTAFALDRNGNQTQASESDWIPYSGITHDASGAPAGFSSGIPTAVRTTAKVYSVAANSSPGLQNDDNNAYFHPGMTSPWGLVVQAAVTGVGPGSSSAFTYGDNFGHPNLAQEQHWDSATSQWLTTNYSYDSFGNLTFLQDPIFTTTTWTYDTNSYCLQTNSLSGTTRSSYSTIEGLRNYAWTCSGNFWGLPGTETDVDHGIAKTYTYDAYGRRTLTSESGGNLTRQKSTAYDDLDRKVISSSDLNNNGDGLLVSTTWYDPLGRVRKTTDPAGNIVQTRRYTPQSGQAGFGANYELVSNPYVSGSEPGVGWTLRRSDQLGRVISVQNCAQAPSSSPSPFSGDACASTGMAGTSYGVSLTNPTAGTTTVSDENSVSRTNYSDGLGRLRQVIENGSEITSYTYDALDNLVGVTQPGGQSRSFTYSSMKRLTGASNPESGLNCYSYDGNGNLTGRTQGGSGSACPTTGGVTAKYIYDGLNNLITNSSGSMGYLFGWLTSVENSLVYSANLSFDGLGRVTSSLQQFNYSFTLDEQQDTWVFPDYTYNLADQLTSMTTPSGRVVKFNYNNSGQMIGVQGTMGSGTTSYSSGVTYAPHGAVSTATLGNGLHQAAGFNSRLQTTTLKLGTTALGSDIWSLTNSFSGTANNGNVLGQSLSFPFSGSGGTTTIGSVYTYDGVNRLSLAAESSANPSSPVCPDTQSRWCRQYGYYAGGNGNRKTAAISGQGLSPLEPGGFNGNNQISDTGWQYDARGNVIQQGTGETFGYDSENRMTAYCPQDSVPANCPSNPVIPSYGTLNPNGQTYYFYDANGRRTLAVTGDGKATEFIYDAAGNPALEYARSLGPGVIPTPQCATCYVTTDHLGSTRVVTDGSGCAVFRQDYLPFGEAILASGTDARLQATGGTVCGTNGYVATGSPTSVLFTGQKRDSESGLDFFGARYFNGAQGRFTSADAPLADQNQSDAQSWNLYGYVRNSPLRFADRSGRDCVSTDGGNTFHDENSNEKVCSTAVDAKFSASTTEIGVSDPVFLIGAVGHHGLPEWNKIPDSLASRFFSRWTTGSLAQPRANYYDVLHRALNAASRQIVERYLAQLGKTSVDQLTLE